MNEQLLDTILEELYPKIYEKAQEVYQIFIDYFGENYVDLQIPSKEDCSSYLKSTAISQYLRKPSSMSFDKWGTIRSASLTHIDAKDAEQLVNNFHSLVCNSFFNASILVWWPSVRITNEYDKSEDITNLYAKIEVEPKGTLNGSFLLNRSEYTYLHITENYMHSHVACIPLNDFTKFQRCCTGTGPINNTICSLNREIDPDIWKLFCIELDKYVHVESLSGGPYHRLEQLGASNMITGGNSFYVQTAIPYYFTYSGITGEKWNEFFIFFVNKKLLKFNYFNKSFSIGMSYLDFMLVISNAFIEWFNNQYNNNTVGGTLAQMISNDIIKKCIIANSKIYYENSRKAAMDYRSMEGSPVCTFKGKVITLHITGIGDSDEEKHILYLLSPDIAMYFLNKILKVLNYRYGRTDSEEETNRLGSDVYFV